MKWATRSGRSPGAAFLGRACASTARHAARVMASGSRPPRARMVFVVTDASLRRSASRQGEYTRSRRPSLTRMRRTPRRRSRSSVCPRTSCGGSRNATVSAPVRMASSTPSSQTSGLVATRNPQYSMPGNGCRGASGNTMMRGGAPKRREQLGPRLEVAHQNGSAEVRRRGRAAHSPLSPSPLGGEGLG